MKFGYFILKYLIVFIILFSVLHNTFFLFLGSMEVVGSTLYSVNRASLSVNKLDLTESKSTPTVLCDDKCLSQITNPFDLAYDSHSNQLYILDASYHPSLPTYQFSIKSIKLADGGEGGKEDFDNMLQFYSRWFSEWRAKQ